MTSYLACKKPRYLENHASQIKSYFGSLSGSHARSFRIRPEAPLGEEIKMTSYLACNKNLVISETIHPREKVAMEHYQAVMVTLSESVMKNRVKRPLGGQITMTSYPACKKPRYLENHVSQN